MILALKDDIYLNLNILKHKSHPSGEAILVVGPTFQSGFSKEGVTLTESSI